MGTQQQGKITKIGVFYDGGYFSRVTQYYRYYERKSRISIKGLHEFIRGKVMELESVEQKHYCQVVDAHYFRGRFSAYDAAKRENQLLYDRIFDDILMYAGVVTHYLPMFSDKSKLADRSEKGIDVWFALEAFELAILKKFDVVVLITGDGDYLPLVKKLNTLGTRVMLLYWDLEFPPDVVIPPVRTNIGLINEATYEVNMSEIMRSRRSNQIVESMFIPIDEEEELTRKRNNDFVRQSDFPLELLEGIIIHIDFERGLGNIKSDDNSFPNIIFFRSRTEDFFNLEKGDRVAFEVGKNERGPMAINVRCLEHFSRDLDDDEMENEALLSDEPNGNTFDNVQDDDNLLLN
ncbi:MAG: NYN domain-containing protein [Sphingobacteriales bacterium]|nr:MAG: NYN domain-containing protein [Sphingobacteriales bacterium]